MNVPSSYGPIGLSLDQITDARRRDQDADHSPGARPQVRRKGV